MVDDKYNGSCLCGSVSYKVKCDPLMILVCHCLDCQKQSGSAFSVNVLVPVEALEVEGLTSSYVKKGDYGSDVTRNFCPKCGSPVYTYISTYPELSIVKAGTLDGRHMQVPEAQIYCDRKHKWLDLAIEKQYAENISAEELFS